MITSFFVILFALVDLNGIVTAGPSPRRQFSLVDDEVANKRPHRPAECTLGKQVHEIGSVWFPDLGPPLGVMYCMKCECIRIQKKRRVIARIQCKNITNECPVPKCDEPILYPGRCCKVCPGELVGPDIVQPTHNVEVEDDKNKHFATLMTLRTTNPSRLDIPYGTTFNNHLNNIVATGRFTFHKKNLYYSFYISDKVARPRLLQFTDAEGNIIKEQMLSISGGVVNSLYQNVTGKVCGVWKRMARDYRRILREDHMYVTFIWGAKDQQELVLSGKIEKYAGLSTEMFSSLLEPAQDADLKLMNGAGATAIVSIWSSVTPAIHVSLVFNGVFADEDVNDVPLNITLMLAKKQQVIMQETKRIANPSSEINVVELKAMVSPADLRSLARGRLVVIVQNSLHPNDFKLIGTVVTRATCELFQTQLSSPDELSSTGLAWVYLNREGSLVYHVQVDDLSLENNSIVTLVDVSGKRKTELEDLTPSFHSGWANGTLEKLAPRVLEPLYQGKIEVNVATQGMESALHGRLQAKPVADARDSVTPLLMKRVDTSVPASAVGIAWFAIDLDCNIHYEVQFSGIDAKNKWFNLYLEQIPLLAPGAPVTRRLLEEDFKGNSIEGIVLNAPQAELSRIDSGISYLILRGENDHILLNATLKEIVVPYQCLPLYSDDNDVSALNMMDSVDAIQQPQKCFHESQFYELGAQWASKADPCTMCHCNSGIVKCDTYKCPVLNCPGKMVKKQEPGVCCPVCTNSTENNVVNSQKGCTLASTYYPPGSSWNPYIPPNGFDYCVTCTCEDVKLRVNCVRETCPPIVDCLESEAIKPNKTSCCKQCPETPKDATLEDLQSMDKLQRDEEIKVNVVQKKNKHLVLAGGGCAVGDNVYENGEEFHPKLYIGSAPKCIYCKCKDSKTTCERKRCTRALCRQNRSIDVFKYSEPMDECCAQKCNRRNRRHHAHRSHRNVSPTAKS